MVAQIMIVLKEHDMVNKVVYLSKNNLDYKSLIELVLRVNQKNEKPPGENRYALLFAEIFSDTKSLLHDNLT